MAHNYPTYQFIKGAPPTTMQQIFRFPPHDHDRYWCPSCCRELQIDELAGGDCTFCGEYYQEWCSTCDNAGEIEDSYCKFHHGGNCPCQVDYTYPCPACEFDAHEAWMAKNSEPDER